MSNLDAIRARHVNTKMVTRGLFGSFYLVCNGCGQRGLRDDATWVCDTAIVLAALDKMTTERNGWADTAREYADERDEWIERATKWHEMTNEAYKDGRADGYYDGRRDCEES